MKKFTESMEDSGTRDIDGTWIPETPQAKLRNRLSPFGLYQKFFQMMIRSLKCYRLKKEENLLKI